MDSFAPLDERVHGGESEGKSYGEVKAQIDAAIRETLEGYFIEKTEGEMG